MQEKSILVTKASGDVVPFLEDKLRKSLGRSGAEKELVDEIINEIRPKLFNEIPTKQIYKMAFSLLKEDTLHFAAKYHLKRGIMELGPSGFPFEKFIGEMLKQQGYSVKVGEIVKGKCVNHEIDVIAEKGNNHFMIECKYHNLPGNYSDVKIPLYIQSRFKDVEAAWVNINGHSSKFHQAWVVTNTRFTTDAIQYGSCSGLKLIGWDYPHGDSLRNQIDLLGIYPLTCLTSLTKEEKVALLSKGMVLCKEICQNENSLATIGINQNRIKTILEEGHRLCEKINK